MKAPQFETVMAELKKQGEDIAMLKTALGAYLENKAQIDALNEGVDSEELMLSQFAPKPATGAIGVIGG